MALTTQPVKIPGYIPTPNDAVDPNAVSGGASYGDLKDDPRFAYTNGSILTPWTKKFVAPAGSGGGGGPAPMGPFSFGTFNPGSFTAEQFEGGKDFTWDRPEFAGPRFQSPGQFNASEGVYDPGTFAGGRLEGPAGFDGGPDFNWDRDFSLGRVEQRELADRPEFIAPGFEEAMNDPGYQFRLKQAMQAITNSTAASGLLRSGATAKGMMDYAQDAASQEYEKVYGRRLGEHQLRTGEVFGAFDRNQAERFGAFDRNTAADSLEQQTAYDRALTADELRYGRAASEYDRDFANRFAVDEANYGRGASEFDRNTANAFRTNETRYGRESSEYDRNYQNQWNQYNTEYDHLAAEDDRNFGRAFDIYQGNYGNRLNAFTANTGAALGGASLNYQMQSGAWDRNYQLARQQYDDEASARAQAAAYGAAGSSQSYNRALSEYEMERDEFWKQQEIQYGRIYDQQRLGFDAAARLGDYATGYGRDSADSYYNGANARASGAVGSANAWQQGLKGVGDAALAYAAYKKR